MFAVLLLAATVTVSEIQAQTEEHLRAFQNQLAHTHQMVEGITGDSFENDLRHPDPGMIIKSMPTPDAQGLQPLEVLSVFPGEPADEAGIKPGDRITFIGSRRIEHETTKVVLIILGNAPNPLPLTIQRGSDELQVTVVQRVLRCTELAITQFDRTKWLQWVEALQEQTTNLQAALTQQPNDIALLKTTSRQLGVMNAFIDPLLDDMERSFKDVAFHTCNPNAPKE